MCSRSACSALALALVWPAQGLSQNTTPPKDQEAAPAGTATPKGSPPMKAPPPPPVNPPPPPTAKVPEDLGQWVYTSQYGWVWMPYGDEYVYTPPDDQGQPYEYLFYPDYGWIWVVAPWIWGIGPFPYFGVGAGEWNYHWYRGPAYNARMPGRPLFHGGYGGHISGGHFGGGGHVGGGRR
jgi:hypothetical protein